MFKWLTSAHNTAWNKAQFEAEAVFAIKRFAAVDVRELGAKTFNQASNKLWASVSHIPNSTKEDFAFLAFGHFAKYYPFEIGEHLRICGIEYARSAREHLSSTILEFVQALDDASSFTAYFLASDERLKESADIEWKRDENFDQAAAQPMQNSTTLDVPTQEIAPNSLATLYNSEDPSQSPGPAQTKDEPEIPTSESAPQKPRPPTGVIAAQEAPAVAPRPLRMSPDPSLVSRAKLVIEYSEEASRMWREVEKLPASYQDKFLNRLAEGAAVDVTALRDVLVEEHRKELRPYEDDAANTALEDVRTISPEAEREFKEVYCALGSRANLDLVVEKIEGRFGQTARTKARLAAEWAEAERKKAAQVEYDKMQFKLQAKRNAERARRTEEYYARIHRTDEKFGSMSKKMEEDSRLWLILRSMVSLPFLLVVLFSLLIAALFYWGR